MGADCRQGREAAGLERGKGEERAEPSGARSGGAAERGRGVARTNEPRAQEIPRPRFVRGESRGCHVRGWCAGCR